MDALEKVFGKTAQMTVLKCLMDHPDDFTYLSGIAEITGLSHSSVARVIAPLVDTNIVIEKPLGKQIRTFNLNKENDATKLIIDFYTKLNEVLE
ncbi:MAG: MarR family transcriptional regulator [Methanosarcinaceae archaeon]|nr:MarR family transcriptional regulator [Methanosarcinaceae archaeon]